MDLGQTGQKNAMFQNSFSQINTIRHTFIKNWFNITKLLQNSTILWYPSKDIPVLGNHFHCDIFALFFLFSTFSLEQKQHLKASDTLPLKK